MFKYTVKRQIKQLPGNVTVFAAVQKDLERAVEIRVLNHFVKTDSDEYLRFEREFKTIARLDHPNIIKVFDWGIANDKIYYVAEMKPAYGLDELKKQGQADFTVKDALEVGRQIGSAIAYLHKNNIVHRDINFSSINYQKDKKVAYIAHFSLVKNLNLEDLTARGVGHFQPLMMTPERQLNLPIDKRTDIWLFGAFMYHLLTGVDLTAAPGDGKLTMPGGKDGSFNFDPPANSRSDLPAEADALIMKALAKQPEDRYQTMNDLQKEFEAIIEQTRVRSRRQSTMKMRAMDKSKDGGPASGAGGTDSLAGRKSRPGGRMLKRSVSVKGGMTSVKKAAAPPPGEGGPLDELLQKVDTKVLAGAVAGLVLLVVFLLVFMLW